MFVQCQQFLKDALKEAGIRTPPITSLKKLVVYADSHVGAILFDQETLSRSGSKRIYRNERGDQQKRQRVYDRSMTFDVIIGEYSAEKAEAIYERFLDTVERGLYINGNFTSVEIEGADWVEKDDSILKAQVAVQVKVRFDGGVYRDTDYIGVKELGIAIEKINHEKEIVIHGKDTGISSTGTGYPGDGNE